jgi:trimeric autotransporter adhesin
MLPRSNQRSFATMQITGLRRLELVLAVALIFLLTACSHDGASGSSSTTATLKQIEVSSVNAQAAVGTTVQLTATAIYSDGSHKDVTARASWSSSNASSVATSSAIPGQVSALSSGTATVSATLQSISGSLQFVATPATLVSLQLTPSTPSVPSGLNAQMVAIGTFSDHTTQDLTSQVTWTSADPTIATVSNTSGSVGLLHAVNNGSTSVTANIGSITDSTSLQVTPASLSSIQVTPTNVLLATGTTEVLTATGLFSDGSRMDISSQVTWTSSNSAAVLLGTSNNQFVALGIAAGVATMTATLGNVTATVNVLVTSATLVSIQIISSASSVPAGNTLPLAALGTYSDNSTKNLTSAVTWSSDTLTVATVTNAADSSGLLRAVSPGSATINATFGGVTSAGMGVTVSSAVLVSMELSPATLYLARGTNQPLTAIGVYSNQTTQDLTANVTWSTSDQAVGAARNGTPSPGLVDAFGVGSATITATIPGGTISSTARLTVSAATLLSLAVTSTAGTLALGTQQPYFAIGTYSDLSTQNLSSSVTWMSDQPSVATISNSAPGNGVASAVGTGNAHISASLGGITSLPVVLTVTPATLVSIQIAAPAPALALGSTAVVSATGVFSDQSTQDLTAQVNWLSSNPQFATVSGGGLVHTLTMGITMLSASWNGVTSAPLALSITSPILTAITVTSISGPLFTSQTRQFMATGTYSDSSTVNLTSAVTWNSDTPGVATVSNAPGANGLATAAAQGTAALTASFQGVTSAGVTLSIVDYVTLGDSAGLNTPWGVGVDNSGNVYVADALNNRICELNAQGGCTVVASTGISDPYNVAIDGSGNIYVADFANSRICRTDGQGGCTTVGNSGVFSFPTDVAVDRSGNVYVADSVHNRICEIDALGGCTVLGGAAGFNDPHGVAVDDFGNVYVDDLGNNRICRIDPQGGCAVLGAAAGLYFPLGIDVDGAGRVYVADTNNNRVCLINAQGGCTALGGSVQFGHPTGVAVDRNGYVYVADHLNNRVVKTGAP